MSVKTTGYVSFPEKKENASFLYRIFNCNESNTVKPITSTTIKENSKSIEEKYYEKYGIIYAGNDESSFLHSLF